MAVSRDRSGGGPGTVVPEIGNQGRRLKRGLGLTDYTRVDGAAAEARVRILFVDDEENVLHGLRRSLRALVDRWDLCFAGSGAHALELLQARPVEVVVTDLRMPGMNGVELLREVHARYPDTVRLILSGFADRELLVQAVGTMHRFLAKPATSECIERVVVQHVRTRRLLADADVRRALLGMQSLPVLPSVLARIVSELQSPVPSVAHIGELVGQDPSLSAHVLRVINSAVFGMSREVTSPGTAVALLGLDTVAALLTAQHVFAMVDESALARMGLGGLFSHSLRVSRTAAWLVPRVGGTAEDVTVARAAGLLHDVGKLLFGVNLPAEYREALGAAHRREIDLRVAEAALVGAPHDWLGAYLLALWGVPASVVEAIARHHDPRGDGLSAGGATAAVHVADVLDHDRHTVAVFPPIGLDVEYLASLGVSFDAAEWAALRHQRDQQAA
jgi:putative nucleotidyltransferase with HDIG domain